MGGNDRIESDVISAEAMYLLWLWADAELGQTRQEMPAEPEQKKEAADVGALS